MSKIVLTCDSTCDLSPELIERYGVRVSPLTVHLGGRSFKDGIDITPDDIYKYYDEHGELPKTAAISIGEYTEFFRPIVEQGCEIIHFNLSSEMSATHSNALLAAKEVGGVYPVDTRNLSTGSALLLIKAYEMIQAGLAASDIADAVRAMTDKVDASFVVNTLEFLHKGGRCSSVAALGANLLKLKPCIEVKNGAMGVGKKYRGAFGSVLPKYVSDRLSNQSEIDTSRIFITHSGVSDPQFIESVKAEIKKHADFKEILVTRAGCTISSHCGADTLGILYMHK